MCSKGVEGEARTTTISGVFRCPSLLRPCGCSLRLSTLSPLSQAQRKEAARRPHGRMAGRGRGRGRKAEKKKALVSVMIFATLRTRPLLSPLFALFPLALCCRRRCLRKGHVRDVLLLEVAVLLAEDGAGGHGGGAGAEGGAERGEQRHEHHKAVAHLDAVDIVVAHGGGGGAGGRAGEGKGGKKRVGR